MRYYSQLGQDVIVDKLLKQKINGTFVDVGASFYDDMNNSYFFELHRAWRGLAVEIDSVYNDGWKKRPNSVYINEDALKVDYKAEFEKINMPSTIDYLSVDLEPPDVTYQAFCKIMETGYTFNVITFEVDYYRDISTRDPARKMVEEMGYILVGEVLDRGFHIDDIYVHNSIYDSSIKIT